MERHEGHGRIIEILKFAKMRQVSVLIGHVFVFSVLIVYYYLWSTSRMINIALLINKFRIF
jgi:hypothetical protein